MCRGKEGSPFSCPRLLNKEEVGGLLDYATSHHGKTWRPILEQVLFTGIIRLAGSSTS